MLRKWIAHLAVGLGLSLNAASLPALQVAVPLSQQNEGSAYPTPNLVSAQKVSVRGLVENALTGEPLPRALVRIEGDAASGALTDGNGRFEITDVPVGPQAFQVIKPGFRDAGEGFSRAIQIGAATSSDHDVHVSAKMEDLVFQMSPNNSIRGQIELSSGDLAQGIGVMLLRRSVQDGRAVWQAAANARTNSDGVFRFAGLADGAYVVYTEPAMDSEMAVSLVESGRGSQISRSGFPSEFYPDARDLAGAARIKLAGGQQAQANILLPQEAFHLVRAAVSISADAGALSETTNVAPTVLDAQGHQLPYPAMYDRPNHAVQAFLPDGTYSFLVTAIHPPNFIQLNERVAARLAVPSGPPLIGSVDFSVAGRPLTSLRIPLAPQHTSTIQVSVVRTGGQQNSSQNSQGSPVVVTLSQAGGWISDGMVSSYAEGSTNSPLETSPMNPGQYWVHTTIPQRNLCEASFTAGGASLAADPLILTSGGAVAPLTLSLRDDCSTLTLSLPQNATALASGDEPYYTVYVVPDFPTTADVTPVTLRASLGGSMSIAGLTPGSYHVYVFPEPVELEYRNPEALAQIGIAGQPITLAPSATVPLVLEVPQR